MQIHEIQPKTQKNSARRVGRGGKRGKTSGRGHKGQKARAGNSSVPQMREIIKKLPKLRGHGKNRARTVHAERVLPTAVNLRTLNELFKDGNEVNPKTLALHGVIKMRGGKLPPVKILGDGEISKKLKVSSCTLSESAKAKVEKAGGTIA